MHYAWGFLEVPTNFFKPLLGPGGGFRSETTVAVTQPFGRFGSETVTNLQRLYVTAIPKWT
jgi:hypothetical protein